MHHIDIHVHSTEATRRLLAAFMPLVGYEVRSDDDTFVSYWKDRRRPAIGFITDDTRDGASGMMRLAFSVGSNAEVDAVGTAIRDAGAREIDGPAFYPEYEADYYAVFFEDASGNKFEVCRT